MSTSVSTKTSRPPSGRCRTILIVRSSGRLVITSRVSESRLRPHPSQWIRVGVNGGGVMLPSRRRCRLTRSVGTTSEIWYELEQMGLVSCPHVRRTQLSVPSLKSSSWVCVSSSMYSRIFAWISWASCICEKSQARFSYANLFFKYAISADGATLDFFKFTNRLSRNFARGDIDFDLSTTLRNAGTIPNIWIVVER